MARGPAHPGRRADDGADGILFPSLDDRSGPARRLSAGVTAEMVRSVIETALDDPDGTDVVVLPMVERTPSRWRRVLAVAATIAGLSIGAEAVAVVVRNVYLPRREPSPAPVAPVPPPVAHPRPAPVAVPPPAVDEEVVVPAPAPEPPPPPARPARRRPVVKAIAAPLAPAPVEQAVHVPEDAPPADLLAFANERRKLHAWREADAFYQAVVSRFPSSDAAVVAAVASAALHLQHLADPAGALEAYRRTLGARPTGPLAEEARWGIADAHRALGNARAEAEALRAFVQNHPDSALAPTAQRRLAQLER
jgi:hypothetical protein